MQGTAEDPCDVVERNLDALAAPGTMASIE